MVWTSQNLNIADGVSKITFLEVKSVKISCGWPLTVGQVRSWIPRLEGRNILLLQVNRLMDLLESRPWVNSVTIRKNYPDEMVIEIATKVPRALMPIQSQLFYVDDFGNPIDKISAVVSRDMDLPLIRIADIGKQNNNLWKLQGVIQKVRELPLRWKNSYKVSEVVLEDYPFLKFYLTSPRVEVFLNYDRWEATVSEIPQLIQNPPTQIRQVRRINLVFPKKAIVSSSFSK
jgi:hypothetical protein